MIGRRCVRLIALVGLIAVLVGCTQSTSTSTNSVQKETVAKRYFKYAVPDWCNRLFGAKHETVGLIELAKKIDADLDLVDYDNWNTVQTAKVGLSCVLPVMGKDDQGEDYAPFVPGFNNPAHYDRVYGAVDEAIDKAAEANPKVPFVLVFSGFDTGEDHDVQYQRIVEAYTKPKTDGGESLVAKAERLGVTLVIEMLNTLGEEETWKGHPGYLANDTTELVDKVIRPIGSKAFHLAFDVYHIVMMGEDPIAMADAHGDVIGYIHVAGVITQSEGHHPKNRGELTIEGQEVDYKAVMAKLASILPEGTYCLLEYIPTESDVATVQVNLEAAIDYCESGIGK